MIINDIPLGVANFGFRQFALTEKNTSCQRQKNH